MRAPSSRSSRWGGGAGTAGALVLLVGCAIGGGAGQDTSSAGGPIASGSSGGECLRARPGRPHHFTIASDIVVNTATEPAEIGELQLVDAQGLDVRKAWLVPTEAGIGDHSTFPPPAALMAEVGARWDARESIPGAQALPDIRYDLVLDVAATTRQPSAAGIRFTYRVGGRDHGWRSGTAFHVRDVC